MLLPEDDLHRACVLLCYPAAHVEPFLFLLLNLFLVSAVALLPPLPVSEKEGEGLVFDTLFVLTGTITMIDEMTIEA